MSIQSMTCGCDPMIAHKCSAHTPAFPSGMIDVGDHWADFPHLGLTLRDYFAAKAMQGWLASYDGNLAHPSVGEHGDTRILALAIQSYAIADAMLKARERA